MPDDLVIIDDDQDLSNLALVQLTQGSLVDTETPGWYKRRLSGLDGKFLPLLEVMDQRSGMAATFRLCRGLDSSCAKQCPLSNPDGYRDRCCPVETQQAWDIVVGLAHEFGVSLLDAGQQLDMTAILQEIGSIDLIKDYVYWALLSWRSQVQIAEDGVMVEVVTKMGKATSRDFKEHPAVAVSARATELKLKILKEFMATKRGRVEAKSKAAGAAAAYGELYRAVEAARKARDGDIDATRNDR